MPGSNVSTVTADMLPRAACEVCRKRKVKCTGERPSCARCERMGKECNYEASANTWSYISALEKRVKRLEDELGDSFNHRPRDHQDHQVSQQLPHRYQQVYAHISPIATTDEATPMYDPSNQHPPTSSLAMGMSGTGENDQIALSSDAQLVARFPIGGDVLGEIGRKESVGGDGVTWATAAIDIDPSLLPPPTTLHALVESFRLRCGASYPIFHIPTLYEQVQRLIERNGSVQQADLCAVLMVLAVACTSLSPRSELYTAWRPRATTFWKEAQLYLPPRRGASGVFRLQIALSRLLYVLYNPDIDDLWDISGSVVRLAIDLGFHRERPGTTGPPDDAMSSLERDMRRRLFWLAYNFDRNVCSALSRPPTIADHWINIPFPSSLEDAVIAQSRPPSTAPISPLKEAALHRFKLRIIHSEILDKLYSVNINPSGLPPPGQWYDSIVKRIDEWQNTLPNHVEFCSSTWSSAKVHLTLMMLYRPSPVTPCPDREGLERALRSSSKVMRLHKELWRTGEITYNWFTVYQLFNANITYINCLWQALRDGYNLITNHVESVLDIQACTSVMNSVTALTPGTNSIRDASEAVAERIIRLLSTLATRPDPSRPGEIETSGQMTTDQVSSQISTTNGMQSAIAPAQGSNMLALPPPLAEHNVMEVDTTNLFPQTAYTDADFSLEAFLADPLGQIPTDWFNEDQDGLFQQQFNFGFQTGDR